jgi:hypothetical protein
VTPNYDSAAISDLDGRVAYEAWLLEAVYEVVDNSLAFKENDGLVFPPAGGPPPTHTIFASANIRIGDWRPGFLNAGAPLVFVTAFKLIDMLMEWVLAANGAPVPWRFSQKLPAIKGAVLFPPVVESHSWLRERLVALYEHLEPLRGTVIHDRTFVSSGGSLVITSSKGALAGTAVTISSAELHTLSLVAVSILNCIRGLWPFDAFREKDLRRALDELSVLHRLPSLAQLPPVLTNVRVYRWDDDEIEIDVTPIRAEANRRTPSGDVVFRVRVIVVSKSDGSVSAFQIPFEQLQGRTFILRRVDRAKFLTPVPGDVDAKAIADALPT